MSPCELYREIEVARRVRIDRFNDQIMLAWRMEQIRVLTQNQHRLPDPRTLLMHQQPRRQSVDEQRTVLHQLAEQYGLTLQMKKRDMH
jgi:hypothetical protein